MSDQLPSPNGSPMVSIPLSRFDLMAECFYNGGPTYGELTGKIKKPLRTVEQRVAHLDDDQPDDPPKVDIPSLLMRIPTTAHPLAPMGGAARELEDASKQRRTSEG